MKKILRMEFYKVIISNSEATVSKEFFVGNNNFKIMFINDEKNDYINTYKTLGFIVIAEPNEKTIFKIFGNLLQTEAENIWSQILNSKSFISYRELDYNKLLMEHYD